MTERIAVVLFNLGGPDAPEAVRPFLFNLFDDPAIIGLPAPLRHLVAWSIARRRAPIARAIYDRIGGGSPLLANTEAQASALTQALDDDALRVFVAMRYWQPRADQTATSVALFAPTRIVLLPLYPQFSTTTTASSLQDWARAARAAGLDVPTHVVCCWPETAGFARASAALVRPALRAAAAAGRPRLLFSAHGLPERVVAAGDPYPGQVERTAATVVAALDEPGLDWVLCYQSRVGPLKWIGPSTDREVRRAGADRVPLVVCPIAFVSEHSETLVEIEIEYRHMAEQAGVPRFERVPAVGTHPDFIAALVALVRGALSRPPEVCSSVGRLVCPAAATGCAMRQAV